MAALELVALWFLCWTGAVHSLGLLSNATSFLGGHYRSDSYLDNNVYPEHVDPMTPTQGGRVHMVFKPTSSTVFHRPYTLITSNKDGTTTSVTISSQAYDPKPFNWIHVHQDAATKLIWLSFHSQNDTYLDSISSIKIVDGNEAILISYDGGIPPKRDFDVRATVLTTQNNMKEAVLHLENIGRGPYTITNMSIDTTVVFSAQGQVLAGGQKRWFTVLLPQPKREGDVLVMHGVLINAHGQQTRLASGARVIKETFPIEVWPAKGDCPFPIAGGSGANFERLQSFYRMDTVFLDSSCPVDPYAIVSTANADNYSVLIDCLLYNASKITTTDSIAGVFLADEEDNHINDTVHLWQRALQQYDKSSVLPTYIGGHSNHLSGIFSGIADIQGFDFYGAGCAPHITGFFKPLPFRAPLDFLRNARNNNMPLPTWLYSQALNKGNYWTYGNEIAAEIAMTIMAGSHALMLFAPALQPKYGHDIVASIMASVEYLKPLLRVADIDSAAVSVSGPANETITSFINGPVGGVLVVLNAKADGYNDVLCEVFADNHWTFHPQTVDSIVVPKVDRYDRVREVVNGTVVPLVNGITYAVTSDNIVIQNVGLGTSADVVRLFIFDQAA
eukprot:TRINITY_DN5911_c0_g1_i1.p1 TRINITY_DN5911_c0_g1~~TRINITY_DN5911_c0_g1_i1.p1  ORF type:complete len:616 (+),score=131.72 TRINITY_DN5911_c0_g1_i1:1-1848(+)